MSNRFIPITLGAATAVPFGLLGGFGPTADHSLLPWLGMLAGWGAWLLVARWCVQRGWWLVARDDDARMSMYLRLLGLTPTATRDDVQRAYRQRAKRLHPDAGGNAAKFRELVEAKNKVLEEFGA
jgi:hypothetical protein